MKRKARVSFLLAFIMLVAFLLAPSTHAQDPVTVYTFIDGAVWHANDDQPIRLYLAWVAMTKGQVNQFLLHHESSFLMTGTGEGEPLLDLGAEAAEAAGVQARTAHLDERDSLRRTAARLPSIYNVSKILQVFSHLVDK